MLTDSQARAILQKFDSDPRILQGMQALAKALSNYGNPPGWVTPDNNWYNVATAGLPNGSCVQVDKLSTYSVPGGSCAFVYHTPEQGIAHMLALWFPPGVNEGDVAFFHKALADGNTDDVVRFALARVWGIGPRQLSTAQLGMTGPWTLGSDFYNAAQGIAQSLGEPLYFKLPTVGLLPFQIVPVPVQIVPIPLPDGTTPGGAAPPVIQPAPPGPGPGPGPDQPPPVKPAPPEDKPKQSGVNLKAIGALAALLAVATGAARYLK